MMKLRHARVSEVIRDRLSAFAFRPSQMARASSSSSSLPADTVTYPPVPNSPGPSERSLRRTATLSESFRTAGETSLSEGIAHGDEEEQKQDEDTAAIPAAAGASPTSSLAVSTITPALQMRLGLTRRLWAGVSQLQGQSRLLLLYQCCFTLAQVAALTTMLALSTVAGQSCRKPLRIYLALHIVRVACSFPINFYNALAPPRSVNVLYFTLIGTSR